MKRKGQGNLTLTQRRQLEALLKAGVHKKIIAKQLGVCLATIYNEIKRGQCEQKVLRYVDWFGDKHYRNVITYSADLSEEKYRQNQSSHGPDLKICNDYHFVDEIEKRVIKNKISACSALGEINRKNICSTKISKTTLYRYIRLGYIFPNITMNDVNLKKRKKYQKAKVKRPPKGTSIEKRPAEISNRQTFGHWEMDCVIGKKSTKDTLLCLTERLTRYEIIFKMPNHKAETIVHYLNKLERRCGSNFRRVFKTITVDNGVEFSDFKGLEKSIYKGQRTHLYYCHPYSSYERGSNERLNREIRRHIPKGTDLTIYTNKEIQHIEDWINNYPREIFGYATSLDLFNYHLNQL